MRDYLKRDNWTWYGVLLLSAVFVCFGWSKEDPPIMSRLTMPWQDTAPSALQPVVFERETQQKPIHNLPQQVVPDELGSLGLLQRSL